MAEAVIVGRGFTLEWYAGPSAQLELFRTGDSANERYELRYAPPFRATLRAPVERRPLGRGELGPIGEDLDESVAQVAGQRSATVTPHARPPSPDKAALTRIGGQLFQCVVPRRVEVDLRPPGLFLELGIDERLVDFPWELMHDGEDFLCNKHFIGRYVNVSRRPEVGQAGETHMTGADLGELSMLLINVPRPLPRGGQEYAPLLYAEAEAQAITETVADIPGVRLVMLRGANATYNKVWEALQQGPYHIVHYSGHAHFDADEPDDSALVLHDRDMKTGPLGRYFGANPPLVCFMNGCETGMAEPAWKESFDIYGLAWSFLETGSYLIGSRWKVDDETAKTFAARFYTALLAEGKALGPAVTDARRECFNAPHDDDLGWASYVLYGDPRMGFRRRRFSRPRRERSHGDESTVGLT
jgi:hypothetical protein